MIFLALLSYFSLAGQGVESHKKVSVIVNPISGGMQKEAVIERLYEALNPTQFDIEVLYTEAPKHGGELAREALGRKAEIIVAVGGDGSVNEIGQALVGTKASLAIIPTGSGNGLARHLGIPMDPALAIDVIKEGHVQTIDTVRVTDQSGNDQTYLGVAGVGFDAEIGWKFSETKRRGFFSYLFLVLKELPRYRPTTYDLWVDGKKITREAFLVAFANSSQFGNGATIAPGAIIDDGFLDLVIVHKFPFPTAARLAYQLFHGTLFNSQYVETIRCKKVDIYQHYIKAHLDGEPGFFLDTVHVEIVPASLNILVPRTP
jgi:YegS/Rv2252/BmrU family lipid kinase